MLQPPSTIELLHNAPTAYISFFKIRSWRRIKSETERFARERRINFHVTVGDSACTNHALEKWPACRTISLSALIHATKCCRIPIPSHLQASAFVFIAVLLHRSINTCTFNSFFIFLKDNDNFIKNSNFCVKFPISPIAYLGNYFSPV